MGKVIIADILKASADNSVIESQSLLGYRQEYTLDEIGDQQFVPKRLINFDVGPQYALIPTWQVDTEYLEDQAVKKLIEGIYYIFVSRTDVNITEPVFEGEDWNLIGVDSTRVSVPITSNPFTYASGIISAIPPKMAVHIVRDAGKLEQWPVWPVYDPATGDMAIMVDTDADSYVLIVG